jgi:hypothetical protein
MKSNTTHPDGLLHTGHDLWSLVAERVSCPPGANGVKLARALPIERLGFSHELFHCVGFSWVSGHSLCLVALFLELLVSVYLVMYSPNCLYHDTLCFRTHLEHARVMYFYLQASHLFDSFSTATVSVCL